MDSPGKRRRDIRAQLSELSKRVKVEREKNARQDKSPKLRERCRTLGRPVQATLRGMARRMRRKPHRRVFLTYAV